MNNEMKAAVAYVVDYAQNCGEYPEHWVNAKNYAVRHGVDKAVAKSAALYVIDNAETLGVKVKNVPHGPHLRPAPYFAGTIH